MRIISQRDSTAIKYFGHDGHGNTRLLLNSSGIVAESYTYDAFGNVISSGTPSTSYLYCGEQFDADLGMYYLRARYLNPNSGRFWTRDEFEGSPLRPQSLHSYVYCASSPINRFDRSGHEILVDDAARTDFDKAVVYLRRSPTAAAFLNYLTIESPFNYFVKKSGNSPEEIANPNYVDYTWGPTIHWHPGLALAFQNDRSPLWDSISPSLLLIHELRHAYLHMEEFLDEDFHPVLIFYNLGATMEFENIIARELGEGVREKHETSAEHFPVPGVTVRRPIPLLQILRPRGFQDPVMRRLVPTNRLNFPPDTLSPGILF